MKATEEQPRAGVGGKEASPRKKSYIPRLRSIPILFFIPSFNFFAMGTHFIIRGYHHLIGNMILFLKIG